MDLDSTQLGILSISPTPTLNRIDETMNDHSFDSDDDDQDSFIQFHKSNSIDLHTHNQHQTSNSNTIDDCSNNNNNNNNNNLLLNKVLKPSHAFILLSTFNQPQKSCALIGQHRLIALHKIQLSRKKKEKDRRQKLITSFSNSPTSQTNCNSNSNCNSIYNNENINLEECFNSLSIDKSNSNNSNNSESLYKVKIPTVKTNSYKPTYQSLTKISPLLNRRALKESNIRLASSPTDLILQ
ncbi:hypothetical protein DLAC_01908 [Tieghemostelium lacteum]|uniref:Uncharacterized protein n=1 Tax=Tieghemostelium lacteum TaxID=361077 RepID=A0A152A6Q7_TIELA|nr:hypothetical protein DLAC_01908 [Tieghemostelium lacteum]|eukprot:KYR01886.1 hypothetical protein DLAC_01908 [Tieghemostelium lacteum]